MILSFLKTTLDQNALPLKVLLIFASISPLGGAFAGVSDSRDKPLYFWETVLPYGSEIPSDPAPQAFLEVGSFFDTMDGWGANAAIAREEKPMWVNFRRQIQSQSVTEIIEKQAPYFSLQEPEKVRFSFDGRWSSDNQYRFNVRPEDFSTKQERLGEFDGHLVLEQGTYDEDNLNVNTLFQLDFDTLKPSEMLETIERFHLQLSPQSLSGDHSKPLQDNDSIDKVVMDRLIKSVPKFMETILSISTFENLVDFTELADGEKVTQIKHRHVFDLSKLKRMFPESYKDFSLPLRRASFVTDFQTESGLNFARMAYDANKRQFEGDATVKEGGLVLFQPDGQLTSQVIYPTTLRNLSYKVVTTMKLSLFGLDIDISDITFDCYYESGIQEGSKDRAASIKVKMSRLPKVETSGALLYFVPPWLIDVLIPGSIEGLVTDSFDDLVYGNGGKGMEVSFLFDESYETPMGRHMLTFDGQFEIPLKTFRRILELDPIRDDSKDRRLYRTLRQNLREDFSLFAARHPSPDLEHFLQRYLPESN